LEFLQKAGRLQEVGCTLAEDFAPRGGGAAAAAAAASAAAIRRSALQHQQLLPTMTVSESLMLEKDKIEDLYRTSYQYEDMHGARFWDSFCQSTRAVGIHNIVDPTQHTCDQ
jgi:hypothetical protein